MTILLFDTFHDIISTIMAETVTFEFADRDPALIFYFRPYSTSTIVRLAADLGKYKYRLSGFFGDLCGAQSLSYYLPRFMHSFLSR